MITNQEIIYLSVLLFISLLCGAFTYAIYISSIKQRKLLSLRAQLVWVRIQILCLTIAKFVLVTLDKLADSERERIIKKQQKVSK